MTDVRVLAVDASISDKLDTEAVAQALPELPTVVVLFSCTNDRRWRSRRWKSWRDGRQCILIKLPYRTVKKLEKPAVAELMVKYAKAHLEKVA